MFGYVYDILDDNHAMVEPFGEEELYPFWGTEDEIEFLRESMRGKSEDEERVIVEIDREEMELLISVEPEIIVI